MTTSNSVEQDLKQHEQLIAYCTRNMQLPAHEMEDIHQEIRISLLGLLRDYAGQEKEVPVGAVINTINRTLYRLVNKNVTFEGCSETTRRRRQALANPSSTRIVDADNGEVDLLDITVDQSNPTPYDSCSTHDLQEKFKTQLTPTEFKIYEYMLQGFGKPREICREIHGTVDLCKSKTISKHMINIRVKFAAFYKKETGGAIKWRKRRQNR